jgi:hypothetical protein
MAEPAGATGFVIEVLAFNQQIRTVTAGTDVVVQLDARV